MLKTYLKILLTLMLGSILFSAPTFAGNSLPTQIQKFGGVFAINDSFGDNCNNENLLSGACSCPGGTRPVFQARLISNQRGANMLFCSSGAPAGVSEFYGAFQQDDSVPGGLGCRLKNGQTGNCSCPIGTVTTNLRTVVDSSGGLISSTIGICSKPTASPIAFGGAYQIDDTSPSGASSCRTPNAFTGSCSCPASGFVAQKIRSQNYWANSVGGGGTDLNICVPQVGAVPICSGQSADPTGRIPADSAIQACLSGTLELPAGSYLLSKRLEIASGVSLRTKSVADTDEACGGNTPCATLIASAAFQQAETQAGTNAKPGLIGANNTFDVSLDHLILDGNRNRRKQTQSASMCANGENRAGFNATFDGATRMKFTNSISTRALCGTGFGTSGVSLIIKNNKFLENGDYFTHNMWADGLTVGYANNSTINNNSLIDNSDVGLIIGGALNSTITSNVIEQKLTQVYAGMMLNSFNDASKGDFSGTTISANQINCYSGKCFHAFNIGDFTWNNLPQLNTVLLRGIDFNANTITGGVITLNVNGAGSASSSISVRNNILSNSSGTAQVKCTSNPNKTVIPSLLNVSPTNSYVNMNPPVSGINNTITSRQNTDYCY